MDSQKKINVFKLDETDWTWGHLILQVCVTESTQHLKDTIILVKGSCDFMRQVYKENTPDYVEEIISQ